MPLLAALAGLTVATAVVSPLLSAAPAVALAIALFFFRDPARRPRRDPSAILAPADGRVVFVGEGMDEFWGRAMREVRIFLAVWHVHVQRCPLAGRVVATGFVPGAKGAAFGSRAHERNERYHIFLDGRAGGRSVSCTVVQVAGLFARTIVCRAGEGAELEAGQKYGMIKLGSMVVLRVPLEARLSVRVGDEVRAGLTVLGRVPDVEGEAA